jgi:hypothetical protein
VKRLSNSSVKPVLNQLDGRAWKGLLQAYLLAPVVLLDQDMLLGVQRLMIIAVKAQLYDDL